MQAPEAKTVTISVLGKDYQVTCAPDEVQAVQRAAAYLDERMQEMKARASGIGQEKLAVMAALNLANELIALTDAAGAGQLDAVQVKKLAKKLDSALKRLQPDPD